MKHDNYYARRGISLMDVRAVCMQLGLKPCYYSHLKTAIGILEVMRTKF